MWHFLTGVKLHPQKKAKLNETCTVRERKEKTRTAANVINSTKKTKMDVFFSSALKCVGFYNGQPRIHQGNQIHRFGCPAF